jgi:septum site-determining protein MinD
VTIGNPTSAPARAYFEAARRLRGETLVVSVPASRKSFVGRLFGRRAVA